MKMRLIAATMSILLLSAPCAFAPQARPGVDPVTRVREVLDQDGFLVQAGKVSTVDWAGMYCNGDRSDAGYVNKAPCPTVSPAGNPVMAADIRPSDLDMIGLPEGMTPSQAANRMLGAALAFATDRAPAWRHNTRLYLYWRQGRAEITQDCFLGDRGACLYTDMTDKALILKVLKMFKDKEPGDRSLQQWVKEDASNVPYAVYFAEQVLARNVLETYRQGAEIVRREDPALAATGPSPRFVVAFVAATGRRLLELEHQDLAGWGFDDVLGWRLIYHPSGVPRAENMAIWFADNEIPFREIPPH